jgi:hypothetical protein
VRIDPTVMGALDRQPYVILSQLPGVHTAPNLALAQQQPQQQAQQQRQQQAAGGGAPAAAGTAAGPAAAAGASEEAVGAQPVLLPSERTPFRWRVIAESQVCARGAAGRRATAVALAGPPAEDGAIRVAPAVPWDALELVAPAGVGAFQGRPPAQELPAPT